MPACIDIDEDEGAQEEYDIYSDIGPPPTYTIPDARCNPWHTSVYLYRTKRFRVEILASPTESLCEDAAECATDGCMH